MHLYFPPLFPAFPVSEAGLDPGGELAATVQDVTVDPELRQKAASLDQRHQVCCGAAVWGGAERRGNRGALKALIAAQQH